GALTAQPEIVAGGVALTSLGVAHNSAAVEMERMANRHTANFIYQTMEINLYESHQTKEWFFYEQLRAYNSLRGEYWTVPAIPTAEQPANIELSIQTMQTEAARLQGVGVGNTLWHLKEAFVLGRGGR